MRKEERDVIKEVSNNLDLFVDIVGRISPPVDIPYDITHHTLNYLSLRCAITNAMDICERFDLYVTHNTLNRLNHELADQYFI